MNIWNTRLTKSSGRKTVLVLFLFLGTTAIGSFGQSFTTLASFDQTDGRAPYLGSLVQGTDGNLYGTTEYGGTRNAGTVFRVSPDGTITTLYSFCSVAACADGAGPYGGLVMGRDGNFYGTTTQEGANSYGTIFKVTSAGVLTTLYNFCSQANCADGTASYTGLALGNDGNFYGANAGFGRNNQGTIFKITPAGKLTTLHTFTGTDGSAPNGVLVQASDGSFYGTTPFGGATVACGGFFLGCGTVFKMSPSGTVTVLFNFNGGAKGSRPEAGLILGADGSLYGTTTQGGSNTSCTYGCGTLFKITTSGTLTTLHIFDSTDGNAPTSPLILGSDHNFYGTTAAGGASTACFLGCGTVFQLTQAGTLTTLHSFDSVDGSNPAAGLYQATSGIFYGTTPSGGTSHSCGGGTCGTVFSLGMGLGSFVATVPTSGKTGTNVIILGNNLTGATAVTFNGTAATFKVVSDTEITTTVPSGATTGKIIVTTPSKTLTTNATFRVVP
jgi:uncharacterized repeat protein (TIGR03803 family)